MSITFQHRTYTKGDKTAILSVSENLVLTTINEESKECASEKEGHTKLRTLGYKKTNETVEESFDTSIEEATSPTAGTRLVKKYGEDAHRAEVRYNPDYQEYQVHHYKDGKHMGEGPVSYHGDDKEDAHDTAKSEAAKRTKNESVEELDEISKKTLGSYVNKAVDDYGTNSRLGKEYEGLVDSRKSKATKEIASDIAQSFKDKAYQRQAGVKKAVSRLTKEDLNEESSDSLKKMSNYHYNEAEYHAKKAGELENNNPKKVRHIEASNRHGAAAIHYDKASTAARRDHKEKQDYHTAHAEEYADAAEEHERTHNLMEALEEAHKLGDTVMIHKGSMAGTKGTIGEIRPGMFKGAPKTYTIDYSEPGKESRQSVQVKKEHIKALKEDTDQLDELSKTTLKSYLEKGIIKGMKDAREGKGDISKKRETGLNKAMSKVYTKEDLNEDQKDSVTMDIPLLIRILELVRENVKDDASLHRIVEKLIAIRDRGTLTMDDYDYVAKLKEDLDLTEEQLDELKKSTLASYTQKAASSMANAAFGQGQASAQYKQPQEKDVKLFSKRLKGIGTATTKLAEARGDADELWDKAEEHKKLANANKDNKEKFHSHMYKHHELIARYHSDLGQHSSAERHDKKADDHYNKAAGFGVDEAVIDPKDTRNPDIPTYLRKQQGQKPLSYAEVKARSTKNVDAYRKRAGVLEDTEELDEKSDPCWDGYKMVGSKNKNGKQVPNCVKEESVEIFPELAAIVENNVTSSVKFKNGETAEVKAEHADALINLHGMLSDENKQKLAEYAHHSAGNFSKVVDWALTKIK